MLQSILHFLHSLYSPEGLKELIGSGGAPLICTIVFIETGFFVGFFLPGDSLLITAGIFAAMGILVALLEREQSGEGQWVTSSLLGAQIAMPPFLVISDAT